MKQDELTVDPSVEAYIADDKEKAAIREVLETYEKGRSVLSKGYNYFGGSNLYDIIDDWTKRWNGYIPPMNPLLDQTQSQIFINFTRNAIIGYLSKVAMSPVKAHIIAVNKKTGLVDQKFANVMEDLNTYSLNAENGDAKFLQAGLECVTKGTVVVYEGYAKIEEETNIISSFNAETGKAEYEKGTRVVFDNCYQEVVPLEDFFITNPFQPDMQKQPKIIWRKITSYSEGEDEFGGYKNWKYVPKNGSYSMVNDIQTFYRGGIASQLEKNQIELLRYYNKSKNRYVLMASGVILYDGPIPFKDGRYPFAKTINEPFAVDFFWGNGHPNKYMGEQDLINSFINIMADKTFNSMQFTGLSSDLDDLIEDDAIEVGKWRKVGDIEKWKYLESPPVNGGEMSMFQQIMSLARESANTDVGGIASPKGGKLSTQQIMMKQQELMQRLSFNMTFLEDLERDRTMLRISHILQFYSIPKIEKVTGKKGKEVEQLAYRDIQLSDTKLGNGKKGNRIIKLVDNTSIKNKDDRQKLSDDLSVIEHMGELKGTPTQALAISVDTFEDYNNSIQVVKYSSYERNQALDQAARMQFAQWRLALAPVAPLNAQGLIEWVEESFDVDPERFENAKGPPGAPQAPGAGGPGAVAGAMPGTPGAASGLPGPQVTSMAPAAQAANQ